MKDESPYRTKAKQQTMKTTILSTDNAVSVQNNKSNKKK